MVVYCSNIRGTVQYSSSGITSDGSGSAVLPSSLCSPLLIRLSLLFVGMAWAREGLHKSTV